ncbi:DUF2306 domain-containing protein [Neolewinella aurantiaca]|uniref:DUF2306 domain-containing protein n=2 Tax=Neolewinella aurantiaca TaxID=2602767 RepID=A0A5C7FR21_9BACT|nr:DUF2306 domain-containing protein [Neolewinella aurantiaca]
MLLITWQYIPVRFDVAFLKLKEPIAYRHYQVAFFGHVYTSIVVLICGIPQFSQRLRLRWPAVHRWAGYAYVGLILLVAAPAGLVMALYANGGWSAQLSFVLQAVLWFWFTYRALRAIRKGRVGEHRDFMLRSFALTLSAISLRLFKWGIVALFAPPPMDTYRIVAWAGWLVNLGLAELWIYYRIDHHLKI